MEFRATVVVLRAAMIELRMSDCGAAVAPGDAVRGPNPPPSRDASSTATTAATDPRIRGCGARVDTVGVLRILLAARDRQSMGESPAYVRRAGVGRIVTIARIRVYDRQVLVHIRRGSRLCQNDRTSC
jgi:hypothetical protein